MPIVRWAPFSAFNSLEREFQSLVDRFNRGPWMEDFSWRPSTDIFKDERGLVIHSEIAGIEPDAVTVEVEGNVLRMEGEKEACTESKEDDRYLKECQYGSFRREILLPEGVDADTIKATFQKGVLEVVIPIATEMVDEAKKVKIEVTAQDKELEPA